MRRRTSLTTSSIRVAPSRSAFPIVRPLLTVLGCSLLLAGGAFAQDDSEAGAESAGAKPEGADTAGSETPEGGEAEEEASGEGLDLTKGDRIKAVSRKTFIKAGRVTLVPQLAVSTNDAFFQHFGVGGRASWHLVDSLAIDFGGILIPNIPRVGNFGTIRLPTLEVVKQQYSAVVNVATLYGYADLGITFSPIYGKFSILGDWIVHFDAFVSGGIGAAFDTNVYSVLGQDLPEWFPGINPAAQVGIGGRFFVFRWLTLRADLRDYVYPQHRSGIARLQNLVMVHIGVGFYFPFDFEYEYAAAKVVDG